MGVSQKVVAEAVGVERATVAQWEGGSSRPSPERLQQLDDHFDARGELVELGTKGSSSALTRSLLSVRAEIRQALLAQLCFADSGRATGWRHNLVPSDEPPSVLSTAYGLKALAILGGRDANTTAVVDWVLGKAVRSDGEMLGWHARMQDVPRLETTATAIDALLSAGVGLKVDDVLRMLERLLDDASRGRPFILISALEPLLRLAPDADLTRQFLDALLACRVDFGGRQLWPEKRLRRDQPMLTASIAHTARAVTVLRSAPEHLVTDMGSAEDWLSEVENLAEVSETIRRDLAADRSEELTIYHFTSAWVVRALANAPVPDRPRIENALRHVWKRYDPDRHFWALTNGDVPVWMLADAGYALHDAALALHPTPVPHDPG
ncbi:helix-turn-helix domain-containing protein [Pseudonocardia sp. S2-4]|uniref:Helix-turn-helix domain-containing protein n=2 Tax=Pseudonocardia humida TaxID=2800819 RepID=A0ABT0ZWM6_9PSEU|nr:helix-turn-helix domain-containing protein [Pseudonocardia humida]